MLKYMGLAKYMHTNGDPVAYPLPVKIALRPEVLAGAFSVAAYFALTPPDQANLSNIAHSTAPPSNRHSPYPPRTETKI